MKFKNRIIYKNSEVICFEIISHKIGKCKCYIDAKNKHLLEKYKFHIEINNTGNVRIRTTIKGKHYSLHRLVLKTKKEVDHIKNNPLDNREKYLRKSSRIENACNRKLFKNNSTGFKGVQINKCGKFIAKITIKKRVKHLGTFTNKKLAAIAYNKAALRYHRDFSMLNKIS
jgi:hypothetical protein